LWPPAVYALRTAAKNLDALSPGAQAETLAFLGHALAQAGRPALDLFEQAQSLDPDSALPIFFHGVYLRQQGALRAAEDLFNQAIALDPQNAAFYVELAKIKAEQGLFIEAEEHYTTAANLAEDNVQLQLSRVRFYANRGYKVAEAGIPAAEDIIEDNPDNAEVYDLLGWMQFLSGEPEQAERSLRRAIELDPNLMSARYHLARLFTANGQSAAALAEYQRIVDWDTSGVFRMRALQDMQQLTSSQ
jgi:superkiller protein 3